MAEKADLQLLRSGERDLTKLDLRNADLTGMDLRGRDFSGSKFGQLVARKANLEGCNFRMTILTQANFESANLRNADLSGVPIVQVNLRNADCSGANFAEAHMTRCDFSGANLSGATFISAHMNEDMIFDGAIVTPDTNFDRVSIMRSTARASVFQHYEYSKGFLVRKSDAPNQLRDRNDNQVLDSERVPTLSRTRSAASSKITARITSNPGDLADMARALSRVALEEIAALESTKPNDSVALQAYERYSDFLWSMSDELATLAATIERGSSESTKASAYEEASGLVLRLREKFDAWYRDNAEMIANTGRIGAMGASTAFLALCGAPSEYAFAASAVMFGGDKLAGYVKSVLGKS